jgi:hypothetical protein
MSEVKVNKISPRTACGTVTLGDSGDTFTIPSGATITNQGTASGFGATGETSWDTTVKTSTFTASAGVGYFCNTSGGAFTVNLPAGTAGASIAIADYAGTFQTNNLTISPNGTDKIGSLNLNATLSVEGQSVTFVYVDSTQGWINVIDSTSNVRGTPLFVTATGGTITTSGNCKIHTFTGPGTFTVTQTATCAAQNIMSHVIIAGGGGGGVDRGGGGGAGGFREVKSPVTPYTASPLDGYPNAPNRVTVTAQAYTIAVGGGGPIGVPLSGSGGPGGDGSASAFGGITSTGGGGGKTSNGTGVRPGGSGGGGSGSGAGAGGTGNTPPVSPAQGNNGGAAQDGSPFATGGGGGGAGAAAADGSAPSGVSPAGGAGVATSITGSPVTRAGGGGSTGKVPSATSAGGSGGGGPSSTGSNGTAGTVNTGGGGGSSCTALGGAGGSGIVIIRYKFQ